MYRVGTAPGPPLACRRVAGTAPVAAATSTPNGLPMRSTRGYVASPASAHADDAGPSGALPTLCELMFASLPILYFRTFLYELVAAVLELCTLGELRLLPPGGSAARGNRAARRRRLRSRRSPARGPPVSGWPEGRMLLLWPELDGAREAPVAA